MIHKCPKCGKPTAKEDRRKREAPLVPQNGASIEIKAGFAPRIRCNQCGQLNILMKGRL